MTNVLDIVYGDTEPIVFYIQEDGLVVDITSYELLLNVGTTPVTVAICVITDAAIGQCYFIPDTIPIGVWKANFKINGHTTGQFTINCTAGI